MKHEPVLKEMVQKYLEIKRGETVVDGTLGLGGHALDILKSIGRSGKLIAFEQDGRNLKDAKDNLSAYSKQIIYIHDNFRYLKIRLASHGVQKVDAIFLDLGLSSPHVDDSERGFSFIKEGPLDMRFDQRSKLIAADILNSYPEEHLQKIFWEYGEEKMARKLARLVCERRKKILFTTTLDFADFVAEVLPRKHGKGSRYHPATKVFQALRIAVNDELKALEEVLSQGYEILEVGGRFVVISYHSLEDRIVKQFFRKLEQPEASIEEKIYRNFGEPMVTRLTKKPIIPSDQEITANPRSRSAKLRAYTKLR